MFVDKTGGFINEYILIVNKTVNSERIIAWCLLPFINDA